MENTSFAQITGFDTGKVRGKVRCLGIDLGTTKSVVTEIVLDPEKGGEPEVRCIDASQRTLDGPNAHAFVPSAVALLSGEVYVGEGARRMRQNAARLGLEKRKNLFYGCKNEMGVNKTYSKAPPGYRNAAEIAGHVLKFLKEAAQAHDSGKSERTVVTVPACFLAAQRNDTLKAAGLAGIGIEKGGLLDEPLAAFLDYLFTYGLKGFTIDETPRNLLVFDFGGGTCDVAIFRISRMRTGGIAVSPLSISHYHRLGGGDIDDAVVHEVLIPQFCEQNNLKPCELSFEDKKLCLEPAFLNAAEALKISLSNKIRELLAKDEYFSTSRTHVKTVIHETISCALEGRPGVLKLVNPEMNALQLEKILEPFMDSELLYARDSEYRMTQSIFSPVTDCLDRCGIPRSAVDACLLAGGSSLLPQVETALRKFLPNAALLSYPDAESAQVSVSRGAAWHALVLQLTGRPFITPVSHEGISIMTREGPVEIIPSGLTLPYPAAGHGVFQGLAVPEQAFLDALKVRVELVSSENGKHIYSGLWNIAGNVVNQGDPIKLEYRFDENRNLWLKLMVDDDIKRTTFSADIENPVTQMLNPSRARLRMLELEEDLNTGAVEPHLLREKARELAVLHADLGEKERAVCWIQWLLKKSNEPDAGLLNWLGNLYGEIGDHAREVRMYREAAARQNNWGVSLFNLALAQKKEEKIDEAMASVEQAIKREEDPPYKVLKAMLLKKKGQDKAVDETLREAVREFKPLESLDAWSLGWYQTAATMLGKTADAEKAAERIRKLAQEKEEKKNRAEVMEVVKEGVLPSMKPVPHPVR